MLLEERKLHRLPGLGVLSHHCFTFFIRSLRAVIHRALLPVIVVRILTPEPNSGGRMRESGGGREVPGESQGLGGGDPGRRAGL